MQETNKFLYKVMIALISKIIIYYIISIYNLTNKYYHNFIINPTILSNIDNLFNIF